MPGGIFLVQGNRGLVEMTEQAYDSEGIPRELLVKYPRLLAGDQFKEIYKRAKFVWNLLRAGRARNQTKP